MKRFVSFLALVAVSGAGVASAADQDPLIEFLTKTKKFSNVPYTDQVRVAPGGYVVYDTKHKKFPPAWEGPVEGEVPVILQGADDIPVPAETLKKLRSLNLDLKIFGVNPLAKLQSGGTVEYSEMILKPSALRDPNAVYDLLKPGSALDKEFREYGGDGSVVYKNQHLYAILTVYYSTGVTITSTKYIGIGGSTGEKIDACPTSITPSTPEKPTAPTDPKKDGETAATQTATHTTAPTDNSMAGIGKAGVKAALIAAGQAAGGKAGDEVTGSGGAVAAKSAGSQVAAAAVKAASGALPSGGGSYCRVDETHVEFHSARPVPIAAQLLRVFPLDNGNWNLLPAIVAFDGEKTKEISH